MPSRNGRFLPTQHFVEIAGVFAAGGESDAGWMRALSDDLERPVFLMTRGWLFPPPAPQLHLDLPDRAAWLASEDQHAQTHAGRHTRTFRPFTFRMGRRSRDRSRARRVIFRLFSCCSMASPRLGCRSCDSCTGSSLRTNARTERPLLLYVHSDSYHRQLVNRGISDGAPSIRTSPPKQGKVSGSRDDAVYAAVRAIKHWCYQHPDDCGPPLITAVPTRSADGGAHDARVPLGKSDGRPRARIGPVWLSKVQRIAPGVAYHC